MASSPEVHMINHFRLTEKPFTLSFPLIFSQRISNFFHTFKTFNFLKRIFYTNSLSLSLSLSLYIYIYISRSISNFHTKFVSLFFHNRPLQSTIYSSLSFSLSLSLSLYIYIYIFTFLFLPHSLFLFFSLSPSSLSLSFLPLPVSFCEICPFVLTFFSQFFYPPLPLPILLSLSLSLSLFLSLSLSLSLSLLHLFYLILDGCF